MKSLISRLSSYLNPKERKERVYKKKLHRPDNLFILAVIVLSLFGVLMVYDSSVAIAIRDFHNPFYFVVEQLKWLMLGSVALVVFSRIDYHVWQRLALPIFIATGALLIAVFVPGIGVRALGAHRWLNFGFFILQPAELAKLSLVIYLSAWFSRVEHGRLMAFLLMVKELFRK